ncbi:hypothetical protein ONQ62_28095, partial [Salmonella enterica subsp. enterica serovar Virginia]|nr:hypothetical protein [Salmonella enterica subsp. enterica serovar Virginia]
MKKVLIAALIAGFSLSATAAQTIRFATEASYQPGYGRKVIMRYTTRREFFDPLRFVRGGNLIDLDWLVESTAA